MTTRVCTESSIVGAKLNLVAVTGIATGVLLLGKFIVLEDEILSLVTAVRTHIRQIHQVAPNTIAGSHDGNTVTLGATDWKKIALGSLVPPIVTAETPGRVPVPDIVGKRTP